MLLERTMSHQYEARPQSSDSRTMRGVTLVEILVAISIMLVLIGVLAPVIVVAKRKAKESSDLNEMHQLGLAGAMYQEQSGDFPTGTAPLVRSGLAPITICSGLVDPYPQGLANMLVSAAESHYGSSNTLVTPYRNSYVGPREFNMSMAVLRKYLGDAKAEGWLVDLSSGTRVDPTNGLFMGRYRRLLNDTSVVARQMTGHPVTQDGRVGTRYYTYDYFGDQANWLRFDRS